MTIAQCHLEIEKPEDLTVGTEFWLRCDDTVSTLQSPELRTDPADAYKIFLLDSDIPHKSFKVTSLVPGTHHLKALQFVDAQQSVLISDLELTVKSVMDPKDPKKEPYGPMGPLEMRLSPWVWGLSSALILICLAGILTWIFFKLKDRKILRRQEAKWGERDPVDQFSLELRRLKRKMESEPEWIPELHAVRLAFLIYIARIQELPLFEINSLESSMPELRKKFEKIIIQRINSESSRKVLQVLREIERVEQQPASATAKDRDQILELSRRAADQIFDQKRGSK